MKQLKAWAATAAMLALAGTAQAALVNRGGGMVYDTTLNITWLADMNFAKTSGYTGTGVNANGSMNWAAAKVWADQLVYGGYSDWRLATQNPTDASCSNQPGEGYGCTSGELSHLFVVDLGSNDRLSVLNQAADTAEQKANFALFSNVQAQAYYSGTADPGNNAAWGFYANMGWQGNFNVGDSLYALAVRPGDAAAAVSEPQTLALALLALGATGMVRRRRPR